MPDILSAVAHRPYDLSGGRWRMAQRWNDLLFAHWPIPAEEMARLLPAGVEVDTFDGFAWVGVVPFWMDQVRTRVGFRLRDARIYNLHTATEIPALSRSGYSRSFLVENGYR